MKSKVITLSFLLTFLTPIPAIAQTNNATPMEETSITDISTAPSVSASKLVHLAYTGRFEEQGIPSYYKLGKAVKTNDVTAEEIVQAGLETGHLSQRTLDNETYLSTVKLHLNSLTEN